MRTKTLLAFSTSPKPPTLLGIIPIICGGTRCAAILSSRLTFLIFRNSSFAAISDSGIIWMQPFLPLGEYINRLRKLPGILALFMDLRILFTSPRFSAAPVMYMIKPASAGFIFYGEKSIQQENGGAKSELKPTKGQIGKIICNTIIRSLVMRFLYEDLPGSTT